MVEINQNEYLLLKQYLLENCGIEIPEEKKYLFNTRLNELLAEQNHKSFGELYTNLIVFKNEAMKKRVIEVMTTNETSFFRDEHPFHTLRTKNPA